MRGNDFTRFQVQLNFSSRFSMWWMIKDVVRDTGDWLLLVSACCLLLVSACCLLVACLLLACCLPHLVAVRVAITPPASSSLTLLRARNAWLCS